MTSSTHLSGGSTMHKLGKLIFLAILFFMDLNVLEILIMIPIIDYVCWRGVVGGTYYCDYDHDNIGSIPNSNKVTRKFNRFLKGIGASHRSWHTHNADVNIILFGTPSFILLGMGIYLNSVPLYLGFVYIFSFLIGALTHVFLDMMTVTGSIGSVMRARVQRRLLIARGKTHKYKPLDDFNTKLMPNSLKIIQWDEVPFLFFKLKIPSYKEKFSSTVWGRTNSAFEDWVCEELDKANNSLIKLLKFVQPTIIIYSLLR